MPAALYDAHADLYDLAFAWDVDDEARWLRGRLGRGARRLLEPGCGSGRMFPPLVRAGLEVVGLDRSAAMLARVPARMRALGLPAPVTHAADMRQFALGETFDGAFMGVGTFGHLLTDADAAAHLDCMAAHLRAGARYLVQLDLRRLDPYAPLPAEDGGWEMTEGRTRLWTAWESRAFDPATGLETIRARMELRAGPRAGLRVEEDHPMRLRDWRAWSSLVAGSAFRQTGAFDGRDPARRPLRVGPGLDGTWMTWHELTRG